MITPDFPPVFGGIGTHVNNLISELSTIPECNITLLICKMRRPNDNKRVYMSDRQIEISYYKGIKIVDFHSGIQTEVDTTHKDKFYFSAEAYHDFRTIYNCCDIQTRLLKNLSVLDSYYDIIHLHDAFNGPLAVLLKAIYRCPLITTIHGINAIESVMIDNLKRYTIFNSDYIITVNSKIKNDITKRYLASIETDVIHNSVNLISEETIVQNMNKKFDTDYPLVFCGRIDNCKGLDILLEAIYILCSKKRNIHLKIIGDGLLKNEMQELTKRLCLEQNVSFLGLLPHDQVIKQYCNAFCIIVPSTKEPFSTVALEGMSCGVPVICSNVDGFLEMISDNINGMLFENKNALDLANKIETLIDNPKLRNALTASAINTIKENFSWQINAKKTFSLYQKLVEREFL